MTALLRCCVLFGLIAASPLLRADDEAQLDGHDLRIHVDWRWIGGDSGGYYPLRIEAANNGATRDVEFAFVCRDPGFPGARRTVKLDAGATTRLTLLVPLARERTSGQFQVSSGGTPLDGLARSITLPDVDPGDIRPAILVVSQKSPNLGALERALQEVQQFRTESTPPSGTFPAAAWGASTSISWASRQANHRVIAPETLPEAWLGFSTADIAILTRADLSALQPGQRRALLDWTTAGGTLMVTEAGPLPPVDPALVELLGQPVSAGWSAAERRHQPPAAAGETAGDPERRVNWSLSPTPFVIRGSGLGQIAVLPGDPFDSGPAAAVAEDWQWLLLSLPMQDLSWTQRHGGSSRITNSRFLEFLIPGQRSVPVGAMLLLVTLFTLAIGPLNYWLAWHRRRLSILLITVPGFALATTLLLFLYSLVAFGFSTQARIRSLTVLDQTSQTAATIARVSLYAPFAPGGGPAFSADTAVLPVHGPGGTLRLDSIDWTERQQLGPGWLPSRTRTQFLTVAPHAERRRLEVRPSGSAALTVSNGFEVGLKAVLIADNQGAVYFGRDLPGGGTAELRPADDVVRRAFLRDWQESAPELPEELDREQVANLTLTRRGFWSGGPRRRGRGPVLPASNPGLLEDLWEECGRQIEVDGPLPPRTYLAILEANPGVATGLAHVVEFGSIHVLRGSY